MKTEEYGNEVSWNLGSECSSDPPEQHGSYAYYTKICTVFKGDHQLTCEDTFGDGWSGGFLIIENRIYCHDFLGGTHKFVDVRITGITGKDICIET